MELLKRKMFEHIILTRLKKEVENVNEREKENIVNFDKVDIIEFDLARIKATNVKESQIKVRVQDQT